jgi:hypothetical protein
VALPVIFNPFVLFSVRLLKCCGTATESLRSRPIERDSSVPGVNVPFIYKITGSGYTLIVCIKCTACVDCNVHYFRLMLPRVVRVGLFVPFARILYKGIPLFNLKVWLAGVRALPDCTVPPLTDLVPPEVINKSPPAACIGILKHDCAHCSRKKVEVACHFKCSISGKR